MKLKNWWFLIKKNNKIELLDYLSQPENFIEILNEFENIDKFFDAKQKEEIIACIIENLIYEGDKPTNLLLQTKEIIFNKNCLEKKVGRFLKLLGTLLSIQDYLTILNVEKEYSIYILLEEKEEWPDIIVIKKNLQYKELTIKEMKQLIIKRNSLEEELIKFIKIEINTLIINKFIPLSSGTYNQIFFLFYCDPLIFYKKITKGFITEMVIRGREQTIIIPIQWYDLLKTYEITKSFVKKQKIKIKNFLVEKIIDRAFDLRWATDTKNNFFWKLRYKDFSLNSKTLELKKKIKRKNLNIMKEINQSYYDIIEGLKEIKKIQKILISPSCSFGLTNYIDNLKKRIQENEKIIKILGNIKELSYNIEETIILITCYNRLKNYLDAEVTVTKYKQNIMEIQEKNKEQEKILIKVFRYLDKVEIITYVLINESIINKNNINKIVFLTEKEIMILNKINIKDIMQEEKKEIKIKKRKIKGKKWIEIKIKKKEKKYYEEYIKNENIYDITEYLSETDKNN